MNPALLAKWRRLARDFQESGLSYREFQQLRGVACSTVARAIRKSSEGHEEVSNRHLWWQRDGKRECRFCGVRPHWHGAKESCAMFSEFKEDM
jgi:hypothetical protein